MSKTAYGKNDRGRFWAVLLSCAAIAAASCFFAVSAGYADPASSDTTASIQTQSSSDSSQDAGDADSSNADSSNADSSNASSNASASSNSSSSASASDTSASDSSPLPWFKSPDLLKELKDTTASSGSASPAAENASYDFKGTYHGRLQADGVWADAYSQTVESTEPDQNTALAQKGGTLLFANGKLIKLGDTSNLDDSNRYGTNAIALAANEATRILMGESILESAAEGANALFATDKATLYANETTVKTSGDYSRALQASCGGTIVTNAANVQTTGKYSSAVSAYTGGGTISVANSTFETGGESSPIIYSCGHIEADNIVGSAGSSQIACINGPNSILINKSKLSSAMIDDTNDDPMANGFLLYQEDTDALSDSSSKTALLQLSDSTISSAIQSGALFYLTNTQAQVMLSNNKISYDSDAAKLLVAAGNSTPDWGTMGRNGVMATFTASNQKLLGDVEVDSISSVDYYLLEKSTWRGSSSVLSNSSGTMAADNLTVSIDATSSWIVTGNSKVANLNLAPGARLVDEHGASVKIVDPNGFTLVDGASSTTITVTGSFSTTVRLSSANEMQSASIDRSDFDYIYGTETGYGTNEVAMTPEEVRVDHLMQAVKDWFANL